MKAKRVTGNYGEDAACTYLKSKGFVIVDRNYETHYGEIDVIAEDDGYLVFVEVKTRVSGAYGSGLESVTKTKRIHLSKAALVYTVRNKIKNRRCRFDVVSIKLDAAGNMLECVHIPAAFDFEGGNYF